MSLDFLFIDQALNKYCVPGTIYAHFLQGFTGLAVTICGIVTLFGIMQLTGRIKWTEKFAKPPVGIPVVQAHV